MFTHEDLRMTVERLRPSWQADGEDLELVEVDEARREVRIRLIKPAASCARSAQWKYQRLEKELRCAHPELQILVVVETTTAMAADGSTL